MNDSIMLDYYRQAYEELKLILDLSFDQITIADGIGVFKKVSKSCEPYFGVKENKLIGSNAFDLEKIGVFDTSVTAEVIRKGEKITLIQKTGANKKLLVTGIPIFENEGKIYRIINVSKDITTNDILGQELSEAKSKIKWFQKELMRRQSTTVDQVNYNSLSMNKIRDLILHICNLDATILLLGETGVGKGYIAKMIHDSGIRKDEPFVSINCGAIPEQLLESELFGYEKGAFTGADKNGKKGLFEVAGKGTIFLDEIGDMPMQLQVKLLHTLDGKTIQKIGGEKPVSLKARIVAATNKNLKKLIHENKFREDLYYRLNVVPINIPPLRERKEDIPSLIKMFLKKFNKEHKTNKLISQEGYNLLINYNYLGNVRELENIIERIVITISEDIIDDVEIAKVIDINNTVDYNDEIIPIKEAVENLERKILITAFEKYKTTRKVAEALKIDQSTVVKKSKKLKINC